MKKWLALFIALATLLSLSACGEGESGDTEDPNSGPMAYTLKKCTYVYPNGKETVSYAAELSAESFIMSYLTERTAGKVNRDSMIADYNANGITAIRFEEQEHGKEVEKGGTTTLKYNADTSTLVRETIENGRTIDKDTYKLVWDSEGRLASYKLTSYYCGYDENGDITYQDTYEDTYVYAYGEDSFTITHDEQTDCHVYIDGQTNEYRENCILRTVTTVPYEEKANITTVESYFEADGTTPLVADRWEGGLERQVLVSNRWGYPVSDVSYYVGGKTESNLSDQLTFDAEGRVTKLVETSYDNPEEITSTVDFSYDGNGNLTEIKITEDGEAAYWRFEWMQIPEKLDRQIAMLYGWPHWSVTEFLDNFISFNWDGRMTVRTYKLSDFLSYIQ